MEGGLAGFINLGSRPDRRAHMVAELARAGLAAERIPAVTPDELPPELPCHTYDRNMMVNHHGMARLCFSKEFRGAFER